VKRYSPACERNREPIADALRALLPPTGRLLEVAAGTGMHAAWIAPRLPRWTWQPSDADPDALASIEAWAEEAQAPGLLPPIELDLIHHTFPEGPWDTVFSANMVHIAPWEAAIALFAGAGATLGPRGMLVLYGPFLRDDVPTAPSNLVFDLSLRDRDPRWGVRHLNDLDALAAQTGLSRVTIQELPANNLIVAWQRMSNS
jgi:SAM-dependent methyltransferase